ncbi:MAG: hypothetical protein ABR507_12590 [Actinomycetota bacterium]|nr:hypothetical protein [Actinomycetota bacterium]
MQRKTRVNDATVRGGISITCILTGAMVAFGAMAVIVIAMGAALSALGYTSLATIRPLTSTLGLTLILVLGLGQFIAYWWGGYAAGRMSRGAGVGNGILVPVFALIIAGVIWMLASSASSSGFLRPGTIDLGTTSAYGPFVALGAVVLMLIGGAMGGMLGSKWHSHLEQQAITDHAAQKRTIDLTNEPVRNQRQDLGANPS